MNARPSSARLRFGHLLALAIVALAVLAGCDAIRPFESVCESRLPNSSVTVNVEPLSYTVDRRLSFAELTARGAALAGEGRFVLGLTEANLRREVRLLAPGVGSRAKGRYCMRPQVTVEVTFNPAKVFMGADEPEGTCRYRLTWDHELRHIAVYQEFLGAFAARIREALASQIGTQIYYFKSPEEAQEHVDRMVTDVLSPLVQAGMEEVRALQRQVDSPEEYARLDDLRRRCE